jgi:hypothetical protein
MASCAVLRETYGDARRECDIRVTSARLIAEKRAANGP